MAPPRNVREQVGLDPSPEEVAAQEQAAQEQAAAAADQAAADQRPEWLLPRFTDQAEQAKAYAESERELGRVRSELGQARDQLAEYAVQQATPPQPQYQADQDPYLAALQTAIDTGDARTLAMLNAQLVQAAVNQALQAQAEPQGEIASRLAEQEVAAAYGDQWTPEFRQNVGDFLRETPQLIPEGANLSQMAAGLRIAAEIVQARTQTTANETAAQQQAAATRAKQLAQGLQGGNSRVQSNQDAADLLIERMRGSKLPTWANQ